MTKTQNWKWNFKHEFESSFQFHAFSPPFIQIQFCIQIFLQFFVEIIELTCIISIRNALNSHFRGGHPNRCKRNDAGFPGGV